MSIRDESEPSHELIKLFTSMAAARSLHHVPFHHCTSPEAEAFLASLNKDKHVLRLENTMLEVASGQNNVDMAGSQ